MVRGWFLLEGVLACWFSEQRPFGRNVVCVVDVMWMIFDVDFWHSETFGDVFLCMYV